MHTSRFLFFLRPGSETRSFPSHAKTLTSVSLHRPPNSRSSRLFPANSRTAPSPRYACIVRFCLLVRICFFLVALLRRVRENVRESGRESLQRDNDRVTENSFSPLSLSLSRNARASKEPTGGREGGLRYFRELFSGALRPRGGKRERERERERKSRERSIPREEEIEWICCPLVSEEKKSKKNATLFLFLLLLLPHHFFFLNVR